MAPDLRLIAASYPGSGGCGWCSRADLCFGLHWQFAPTPYSSTAR